MKALPGGWEPNVIPDIEGGTVRKHALFGDAAFFLEHLLTEEDCKILRTFMGSSPALAPVSIHGRNDIPDEGTGSLRTTAWYPALSEKLWGCIHPWTVSRTMSDTSSTDWWQHGKHRQWKPIGVSPLLRFMRYEKGGEHFSHYDAGFIYPDTRYRTLMSIVLYLTTNLEGGSTRFITDDQEKKPVWERTHDDWTRRAASHEVRTAVSPQEGAALIFDHRICHDVEPYYGATSRIIIRGDLIFESEADS